MLGESRKHGYFKTNEFERRVIYVLIIYIIEYGS